MINEIRTELEQLQKETKSKLEKLKFMEKEMLEHDKSIKRVADSIDPKIEKLVEKENFIQFFKKPYAILPQGKNKILVAVPKFIKNFQPGWLFKETETYYLYQLDQYSAWLGDVPNELLKEINFEKEFEANIIDDRIYFSPEEKERIKKKLGKHINDLTDNSARIMKGHEFTIIADMVEAGNLPFKPSKVIAEDKRVGSGDIKLRPYQVPAYEKFLETGAIGLFHPTGSGKSFITLHAFNQIKGPKLVVVPSRSLVEQWAYLIETHLPDYKNEIEISTYQGFRNTDKKYSLVAYDECQRLPANSFSKLALIDTKYRIGLSASPHREDGRESYIFALTGYPVGLNWQEYMKTTGWKYHPINVHVTNTEHNKILKAIKLVDLKRKTMVFCDRIELGKTLATKLGVPFIYGDSKNRLETMQNNQVCVVSRVMDLGISVKDLKHVVEVDFLFGSRQQELQRTGRLMHSLEKDTRHDIIMTQNELDSYGKRLWSLQEKGFKIKVLD